MSIIMKAIWGSMKESVAQIDEDIGSVIRDLRGELEKKVLSDRESRIVRKFLVKLEKIWIELDDVYDIAAVEMKRWTGLTWLDGLMERVEDVKRNMKKGEKR